VKAAELQALVKTWLHLAKESLQERQNIPPAAPLDRRNLRSEFKGIPTEQVRTILDARRRKFGILAVNTQNDFNLGNLLRTHNAFLGSNFYYLGQKRIYTPSTVGTHHYEPIEFVENLENARKVIPPTYTWVGLDNLPGAIPIDSFEWPENPLIVVGSESQGLDFFPEIRYNCQHLVEIPQFGSVRSLNMAVALGIAVYDLCLQQGWLQEQRENRQNRREVEF
jgi:tRNA G18 (ribose-2'-O)-methylase SpoU